MKIHERAHDRRSNPHHDHRPSDEMDLLIETINSNNLGWKADPCKLQKHHHMYTHCEKPQVLAQVSDENEGQQMAQTLAFGKG